MLCVKAHSKEELDEWKQRFHYRTMKLQTAKEKHLHGVSYADQLLDKLNSSSNYHSIISDKVRKLFLEKKCNESGIFECVYT